MVKVWTEGTIDRQAVQAVRFGAPGGVEVTALALGARITHLFVPDRAGVRADVVLGLHRLAECQTDSAYLGATCGRFANRIAGGRFTLDGREFDLDRNEGANTLHGGTRNWSGAVWDLDEAAEDRVSFTHLSPDGDMGFPGAVRARCTYRLEGLVLWIEMTATSDRPTHVNMAHHSYFNLAGHAAGTGLAQMLRIEADSMLPVDDAKLPDGPPRPVAGTAFDFRSARPIGAALPGPGGFDHCFCLSAPLQGKGPAALRQALDMSDQASGRRLRLATDQPGLQVYTGAHFAGTPGKAGAVYGPFQGVALETQAYPDAPNRPDFPSTRLDPGGTYRHLMRLDFTPG
jgi:aldose 1-epimerase